MGIFAIKLFSGIIPRINNLSGRSYWAIVSLICCILFSGELVLHGNVIRYFQRDSDILVTGRVVYDELNPHGMRQMGLVVVRSSGMALVNQTDLNKEMGKHDTSHNIKFLPYYSQFGLHGDLTHYFWNAWEYFGGKFKSFVISIYCINLAASVSVLFLMVLWFKKELGRNASAAVLMYFFGSGWIISMTTSIYWAFWTWLIPVVLPMYLLRGNVNKMLTYLLMYGVLTLRYLCGYEFSSTITIATIVPAVYFAFKNGDKMILLAKQVLFFGLISTLALFSAIGFHLHRLTSITGAWETSFKILLYTIMKRGGTAKSTQELANYLPQQALRLTDVELESLAKPFYRVLAKYLLCGDVWVFFPVIGIVVLLVAVGAFGIYRTKSMPISKRMKTALIASILTSSLAPLSWFILMKGHAVIHLHIDYILWSIPFLPWLFASFGHLLDTKSDWAQT